MTVDARMSLMDDKKRKFFVWFVVGMIFLGGFVFLGVYLSSNSTQTSPFSFLPEGVGAHAVQDGGVAWPKIDLQRPETTEVALFALG